MAERTVLITGVGGLVGSSAAALFHAFGWRVVGLENDARGAYFGPAASIGGGVAASRRPYAPHLADLVVGDIADERSVQRAVKGRSLSAVIHAAAQPSHDKAAEIPLRDFDVNARGTLLLLEAVRRYAPEAPFVFLSTNKVYGDSPNFGTFDETETRFDWAADTPHYAVGWGIRPIDRTKHSLFGCSKAAADLYVQEYGLYFGLRTMILRAGCLTGGAHRGAEQHGFLAYLARCVVRGEPYRVYGFNGKQVRDNLDSRDLADLLYLMVNAPSFPGDVFNVGGGFSRSCSVREAVAALEVRAHRPALVEYGHPARPGDHRVYYTDNGPVCSSFSWMPQRSLDDIYGDLVRAAS